MQNELLDDRAKEGKTIKWRNGRNIPGWRGIPSMMVVESKNLFTQLQMTDNSDLGQLVAQEKVKEMHHDYQITTHKAQKQELETQRVKLCALSSPIRKATNEVLLQILQDACEANDLYGYFQAAKKDIFDGQGSPHAIRDLPTIAMSNVCSRWRNLALSSPSLWANLAIRIYAVGAESKEAGKLRFIDKVTRFLERSACPTLENIRVPGRTLVDVPPDALPSALPFASRATYQGLFRQRRR
ncbi:hypothetical protein BDP27DRAFT_1371228 [Rhodocollybia butyracea]|uniref:F-box domain-containing protein n=1 Tax=Rhodocollybia butyracea TaxID=206335 RepID=A0A9P5TXQ2_9AGAR|nr:hypothetical protein BDP27DRAFT_1371228 [Rhodocollybia butyracea]